MQAFHIAHHGRRLAAILHEPRQADSPPPVALLICNPFGQEAQRVHRMQKVLCEQLQRGGLPSLRFDYHGAGESSGDDRDADLAGWVSDILAADQALRERTGAQRVLWLGARLGGSLALLAAAAASVESPGGNEYIVPAQRPAGLLLWEPVIDGAHYLASLRQDHERALHSSFGPFLRRVRTRSPAQLLGVSVGEPMLQQLHSLRAPLPPVGLALTVVAPPAQSDDEAFAPALEHWMAKAVAQAAAAGLPTPRRIVFSHQFDWTAEEALNTALVPAPAVRLLRTEVEALR